MSKIHNLGPRQLLILPLIVQQSVSLSMHPLACFITLIADIPPETALLELPKPH